MYATQIPARPTRGRRALAGALAAFCLLAAPVVTLPFTAGTAVAQQSFDAWVRDFWPQARAAGISRETYDRAFRGVTLDQEVLRLASRQAEFVKPIWEYLDSAVSDSRIRTGRQKAQELSRTLDAIEQRYGVERQVLLSIWGMESSYGAVLDNTNIVRPVIRSLATLAYGDQRRSRFGREQLIAALKILERGDIAPERMMGSWAGAMGHTQFIPTTFEAHAVDFDGDGRRNIWTSVPDALASAANYLRVSGWRRGETWGYEVELPRGFDFSRNEEGTSRSLSDWQRMGLRRTGGRDFPRGSDQGSLFLPAGARGPAFLLLPNFRVIKRYNNADSYALAVGHLADRIIGAPAFQGNWPRNDRSLARSERRELQQLLTRRGHDTGGIDGQIGPMTRAAIRSYQAQAGLVPDGYASSDILDRLRR